MKKGPLYKIEGIRLRRSEPSAGELKKAAAQALGLPEGAVVSCRVLRRSLDARGRRPPLFVFNLEVETEGVPQASATEAREGVRVKRGGGDAVVPPLLTAPRRPGKVVVVGAGPAGLFAALTLALNGIPGVLLERGRPVEERVRDVEDFWSRGVLKGDSNVYFGEGGAGTFSDGKLTTRLRNPYSAWVKTVLVEAGAPHSILIDAKPHIGTDRLRLLLPNLRRRLLERGWEFRFRSPMTDIIAPGGVMRGIVVGDREELEGDHVILAVGQGAYDTYLLLHRRGVAMETKPFAVGVRVEHPQALIDRIQYGRWAATPGLPPADYALAARLGPGGRAVYSFCMCPGGFIVASASGAGEVVTNGMSDSGRDGPWANSALVVSVDRQDVAGEGDPPLGGLFFRRRLEERAYEAAGGGYLAPAQTLKDFLAGRERAEVGYTTYRPGVRGIPLAEVLPPFVTEALREGLKVFAGRMPGFVGEEAVLVGVETRTSAPVRILRGEDGQSVTIRGLYPCGEGAGYAGGIMSSALDGIRAALRVMGGR